MLVVNDSEQPKAGRRKWSLDRSLVGEPRASNRLCHHVAHSFLWQRDELKPVLGPVYPGAPFGWFGANALHRRPCSV